MFASELARILEMNFNNIRLAYTIIADGDMTYLDLITHRKDIYYVSLETNRHIYRRIIADLLAQFKEDLEEFNYKNSFFQILDGIHESMAYEIEMLALLCSKDEEGFARTMTPAINPSDEPPILTQTLISAIKSLEQECARLQEMLRKAIQ